MRVASSIRIALVLGLFTLAAEAGEEPLDTMVRAVKSGDLATVEKLLREGFDPNTPPGEESAYPTLLAMAINENKLAVTEALLKAKADPAIESASARTAMMDAAKADRIPHAKLLLQHGVSINSRNREGNTPLIQVAIYDEGRDTQAIVDLGASVDLPRKGGRTALMIAAEHANSAVVGVLLKAGANPNRVDEGGKSALMLALGGENPPRRDTETAARVVGMLLEAGANINLGDPAGQTALMQALDNWQVKKETIKVLLAAKPKVDIKDKDGRDALFLAVMNKEREGCLPKLVKLGGDIRTADKEGVNLLMLAARRTNPALVAELLEQGLSPQAKSVKGWTAAHEACDALPPGTDPFRNNESDEETFNARVAEILKLLHGKGASLTVAEENKLTPLHLASRQGNPDAVSFLLPHYPDAAVVTQEGSTPLHFAAANNAVPVIDLLLPRMKETDPRDEHGFTPLADAAARGAREAVIRLKGAGADINGEDKEGTTSLQRALADGNLSFAKVLMEQGADPGKLKNPREQLAVAARGFHDRPLSAEDYAFSVKLFAGLTDDIGWRDAAGMTTLMWVAASNNRDALRAVLARGPDLQARSRDGRTALMWAASTRALDALKMLKEAGADGSLRDNAGKDAAEWLAWSEEEAPPGDILISGGSNGLWERIGQGQREELAAFVARGGWNAKDRIGGDAPLHLAAGLGDTSALETLVDRGAVVDQALEDRRTPLMEAVAHGREEAMKLLLKRGADPARRDSNGQRAIDLALHFGHPAVVRILLEQPEPLSEAETELLARAVARGDADLLRVLFKKGARVRDFKPDEEEPDWNSSREIQAGAVLIAAARRAEPSLLRVLMEFPEASGALHMPLLTEAMHHAAENGRIENVRYLIDERKVDADSLLGDSFGGTTRMPDNEARGPERRFSALSRAIEQGHKNIVRYLVERGVKIQGRTRGGEPPLSFAVSRGDMEMVRYLLDHKASTDLVDFDGMTALHHAAEKNRAEMVKLLLERGAERNAKESRNKTPLDLAIDARAAEAVKALEDGR